MPQLREELSTEIDDGDRFPGVFALSQTDAMGLGEDVRLDLQMLIDEAEIEGNAVVDIPPGVFVLSAQLNMRTGGIHLRGAGKTRTTLRARDGTPIVNTSVFTREPPAMISIGTDEGGVGLDADDILITGITFDGNVGAYTDDVILGNDNMSGVSIIAGNRITFHDCVFKNMARHGISCDPLVASQYEDITIEKCEFFDVGQFPVDLRAVTRGRIDRCRFARCGDSAVNLSDKPTFTGEGGCVECEVLFCRFDRSVPPTRIYTLDLNADPGFTEQGHFVAIGRAAVDTLIEGCHMFDNRNAFSDGIGSVVIVGFTPTGSRVVNNHVILAGAFGIDIGSQSETLGNIVDRCATNGLYYGLDLGGDLEGAVIDGNQLIDCNEADVAGTTQGISLGGGIMSDHATSTNTVITNNLVYDKRGTKRCDFGIAVSPFHDADGLIIDGNRCVDVLTSSFNIGAATIAKLRLGDNQFIPGEWYGKLDLVAGTVNTATLPMPTGVAVVASVTRIDKLASTAIGSLEALSVPATPIVTLNSLDAVAAVETNDVSRVLWHIHGTADAY